MTAHVPNPPWRGSRTSIATTLNTMLRLNQSARPCGADIEGRGKARGARARAADAANNPGPRAACSPGSASTMGRTAPGPTPMPHRQAKDT